MAVWYSESSISGPLSQKDNRKLNGTMTSLKSVINLFLGENVISFQLSSARCLSSWHNGDP